MPFRRTSFKSDKSKGFYLPKLFRTPGGGLDKGPIASLNPILWYDFSDEGSVTLSSTTITGISDKGSLKQDLVKSTTGPTQATWTNNSLTCCDWGTVAHSNYLRTSSTFSTTIAEAYIVLDSALGSVFPTFNGLITGSSWFLVGSSGGTGFFADNFSTAYVNGSSTNVYTGGVLPDINSPSLLRVGRSSGSFTANSQVFQIGMDRSYGGRGWLGLVAEVIVFSSALSVSDRDTLQNFLASKWNLTLV